MVYILASLKKEIDLFLDLTVVHKKRRYRRLILYEVTHNNTPLAILRTGIGRRLLEPYLFKGCTYIVSTGFCGALTDELKSGNIVVSDGIMFLDEKGCKMLKSFQFQSKSAELPTIPMESLSVPPELFEIIEKEAYEDTPLLGGKTLTAARVVKNASAKATLNKHYGVISVEMEDYLRLQLANNLKVPFISLRSVLDELYDDIPGFKDGFRMGSKVTSILSKLNIAQESLAVGLDLIMQVLGKGNVKGKVKDL